MRKNPAQLQVAENNQKINRPTLLTDILGYPIVSVIHMTESSNNGAVPKKRVSAGIAYILRFNSKAQKKRIEEAASGSHRTLREFLLDLAEEAAAQHKKAS